MRGVRVASGRGVAGLAGLTGVAGLAVVGVCGLAASAGIATGGLVVESFDDPTPLAMGDRIERSLLSDGSDAFVLDLPAEHFVIGSADQLTVDVVVTIEGPDGEPIGRFDGPASGPEWFRFETDEAGVYTVTVTPFEEGSGRYEVSLLVSEPIAEEPGARVKQLVAQYDLPGMPGGAIAVVDDGEVIFGHAFGMANLAYGVEFELDTPTNIGSTSKQFTAYAICLLADRGELSLDDDVRAHIPELPEFEHTVTLRHLLTHTSGYREFLNTVLLGGRRLDRGDSIDRQEIIEVVQRQPALQNVPGGEWNYNNTAFGLLSMVVERVSGEDFDDWMDANIFSPLGMDDSVVRMSQGQIIPGAAQGYVPAEGGGFANARDLGASTGAGGIYASVDDLVAWVRNYRSGELGGSGIFEAMATPFVLNDGSETGYGFGLFIDEQGGLVRIHHGGADTAHRSQVVYYPEIDAAVIVQSNHANFTANVAFDIAERFFGDEMELDEREPGEDGGDEATDGDAVASAEEDGADDEDGAFDPEAYDAADFDRFAGRYELEAAPGFILTFSREGETLHVQATGQPRLEIVPVTATRFKIQQVDAELTFQVGEDGGVTGLMLHQNGNHPATRLDDEPGERDLAEFAGRYFSEELGTFYEVTVNEEGALVVKQRRLDAVTLTPSKGDTFSGGMPIARAEFKRDEEGNVVALIVGNGRTRGIRFERWD